MASKYYLLIQDGLVFQGTISEYTKKFYTYPSDWSEDDIIEKIKEWAAINHWSITVETCH